jgi:hypothetical protein
MDAANDIHKEMLPIWAAFLCGYTDISVFPHIFISETVKRLLIPMNSLTLCTSCVLSIAMKSLQCIGHRIGPMSSGFASSRTNVTT